MPEVFEVYTDARGEHRFRLKAPNGEVIASSEGYKAKASCLNGIESVKENVVFAERFDTYEDSAGEHRFRLKAANGEIIATGEGYSSEANLMNGIEAVKRYAQTAGIVHLDT